VRGGEEGRGFGGETMGPSGGKRGGRRERKEPVVVDSVAGLAGEEL